MAGSLANYAVALAVVPVLTRYLVPSEFGSAALFTAVVAFTAPLVGMSLRINIDRNYFKVDQVEMARIAFNALGGVIFNFFILIVITFVISAVGGDWLTRIIGLPFSWILFAFITALAISISSQFSAFLRIRSEAGQFAAFSFSSAALNLSLSLGFVVIWAWGWQGRAGGYAASAVAMAAIALFFLRRKGLAAGRIDRQLLRGLYRVSLPLVPHTLAAQVTALSSRFFLNVMVGAEAVGLYSLGYRLGGLLQIPMLAFTNAWMPWVFERLSRRDQESDRQIVRAITLVTGCLIVAWVGLIVTAPLLLRIFATREYEGSLPFVKWVGLAFVFQGLYSLILPILVDAGKTELLAVFTVVVAAVNLGLNYVLIGQYGMIGVAYSDAFTAGLKLILVFWYVSRVRRMPWMNSFAR